MLSKRKMTDLTLDWLQYQLEDVQNHQISLKDDVDGVALRVVGIKRQGPCLLLDLAAVEETGTKDFSCCLLIQQKIEPSSIMPDQTELSRLDNTP